MPKEDWSSYKKGETQFCTSPSPQLCTFVQQSYTEHVCQANACWEENIKSGSRALCPQGLYILVNREFKLVPGVHMHSYKILKGTKLKKVTEFFQWVNLIYLG